MRTDLHACLDGLIPCIIHHHFSHLIVQFLPIMDEVRCIWIRHDFSTFLFEDCNHSVGVRSLLARPLCGCPFQHFGNTIELRIYLSPYAQCPFDLMSGAIQPVGLFVQSILLRLPKLKETSFARNPFSKALPWAV